MIHVSVFYINAIIVDIVTIEHAHMKATWKVMETVCYQLTLKQFSHPSSFFICLEGAEKKLCRLLAMPSE